MAKKRTLVNWWCEYDGDRTPWLCGTDYYRQQPVKVRWIYQTAESKAGQYRWSPGKLIFHCEGGLRYLADTERMAPPSMWPF